MNPADLLDRDALQLWLLAALAAVLLAALVRAAWKRMRMRSRQGPMLVYPADMLRNPMAPGPHGGLAWPSPALDPDDDGDRPFRSAQLPPVTRQNAVASSPAPQARGVAAAPAAPPRPAAVPRPWPARPAAAPAAAPPVVHGMDDASETIRLPTAADGTVQLLPGLLVMEQGPEVGREFRFLRVGSQPIPELTIGRANGPMYRHIQIPAATVSRMHARIRYTEGRWRIGNLSTTNPLRVNGRELDTVSEVMLVDGDRIQIGEVELSYRDGRS